MASIGTLESERQNLESELEKIKRTAEGLSQSQSPSAGSSSSVERIKERYSNVLQILVTIFHVKCSHVFTLYVLWTLDQILESQRGTEGYEGGTYEKGERVPPYAKRIKAVRCNSKRINQTERKQGNISFFFFSVALHFSTAFICLN